MSETRLGIELTARDLASARIAQVEQSIKSLEQGLKQLITTLPDISNASNVAAQSMTRLIAVDQAKIASAQTLAGALRNEIRLMDEAAAAAERLRIQTQLEASMAATAAGQFMRDERGRFLPRTAGAEGALAAQMASEAARQAREELRQYDLQVVASMYAAEARAKAQLVASNAEQLALARTAQAQREGAAAMEAARSRAYGGAADLASFINQTSGAGRAAAFTRQQIEEMSRTWPSVSAGARGAGSAAREAAQGVGQLGFAFREATVLAGEFARGQRGQEISTLFATMRRLGASGALFIAPVVALGAGLRVESLVREYAELATKTDDAARAAGIGVEQYSRLQRVLQLAGIDSGRLATAMGQLSQSMRTAISEPLSDKGAAFATILGSDFLTALPKLMEEPLQSIELLRKKYQELRLTMSEFQAMGTFRAALGRTEWAELASIITASDQELRKWNAAVDQSHLPFTAEEVARLREVDFATRKLVEDWEGLGKAVALLAGSTGFISWLDSIVLKLDHLARLEPPVILKYISELLMRHGPVMGPLQLSPFPEEKPPGIDPEAEARAWDLSRVRGGATVEPRALIEQAVRQRELIEQSSRLRVQELEAQKAEAGLGGTVEQQRARQLALERQIGAARQEAVRAEQALMKDIQSRAETQPWYKAEGDIFGAELQKRMGVQIGFEQLSTRREAAELEKRVRDEQYRTFMEQEREKLELVKGNAVEESRIYQEMAQAAQVYSARESASVQRDYIRAAREENDRLIQSQLRSADTEERVGQARIRSAAAQADIARIQRGGRPDDPAGIAAEIQALDALSSRSQAAYLDIANMANATAEQKIEALDRAQLAAEEVANREVQLARKVAEEQKRQAEESVRVFTQFFDKTGGAFENLLDAAVFRSKTGTEAFRSFFLGIDKDLLRLGEGLVSQLAGKGLGALTGQEIKPGAGLGEALGQVVGGFFGLGTKPDAQTAITEATQSASKGIQQSNVLLGRIEATLEQQRQGVDKISTGSGLAPVQRYPLGTEQSLDLIEHFETGGRNIRNLRGGPASGYAQFLPGTWREIASKVGVDVSRYPEAISASREVQRDVERELFSERGFQPWLTDPASRGPGGLGGWLDMFGPRPAYQHGGPVGSTDTVLAWLTPGEYVLTKEQAAALPKMNSGGYVWPSFQYGGNITTQSQGFLSPHLREVYPSPGAGRELAIMSGALAAVVVIGSFSSRMSSLTDDVRKTADGLSSFEKGLTSATGASQGFAGGLLNSISSITSIPRSIGSAVSGVGGLFGGFKSLFGFASGGSGIVGGIGGTDSQLVQFFATPGEVVSVRRPGQSVGGIPRFAYGGNLVVGGDLGSSSGGIGTGGGVNIHIGSINGVMNAHDVDRLLTSRFSAVARGFQRASRNNFDLPG